MIIPDLELINDFKRTPGAISVAEAFGIYNLITNREPVKEGCFIDVGSNAGKSSMMAAAALSANGSTGDFHLIDPVYNPDIKEWQRWAYAANNDSFVNKVFDTVSKHSDLDFIINGMFSTEFLSAHKTPLNYVFIDSGDHESVLLKKELDMIVPLMKEGALIIFHDFGNQFFDVVNAANNLVDQGFKRVEIDWESIREYVKSNRLEDGNDSWHIFEGNYCPSFIGALTK